MISYVFEPKNSFNSQFITVDPLCTVVALEGDSASCFTMGPANVVIPVTLKAFKAIRADLKSAGYMFLKANDKYEVKVWNNRPSNNKN